MRTSGGAPAASELAPDRAGLQEPGTGRTDGRPGSRLRCCLGPAAWVTGTGLAFAVYLRLAQTRAVNSDGASQALQAWDMLHGNPLLRGWTTSDVSFYTTELPEYALAELIRGLRADVVPLCAAVTYTLVVLLAALVAAGRRAGRGALPRVGVAAGIMLAPQLGSGTNQLLSSPDHIGTAVPLLLTWLAIDRCGRRWYVPLLTSALLCLAQVADSITLVAGIVPLALVGTVRAFRYKRCARYELALAGGALAAALAAVLVLRAVTGAGGFTVRPLNPQLAPLGEIFGHNLLVAGECLLLLFGAYPGGPPSGVPTVFLLPHLAGIGLAAIAVGGAAVAAWRRRGGGDLVSQVLLAAIVVNLGAFAATRRAVDVTSAREIAPVLPFAAALAARQLSPVLAGLPRLGTGLLAVAGAGCAAGLGLELTAPPAPPQSAPLTSWLTRHQPGGVGLGGYWQASVVTLASGGTVAVRPVTAKDGGVGAHPGEVKDAWFDPRRSAAQFVVFYPGDPGYPGYTDYQGVRATWGPPRRVYHVGRYTIWCWPENLLLAIRR